jgi:hypothetical protein
LKLRQVKNQMKKDLDQILLSSKDWREAVNEFKDREMFRIDMRHIRGTAPSLVSFQPN